MIVAISTQDMSPQNQLWEKNCKFSEAQLHMYDTYNTFPCARKVCTLMTFVCVCVCVFMCICVCLSQVTSLNSLSFTMVIFEKDKRYKNQATSVKQVT